MAEEKQLVGLRVGRALLRAVDRWRGTLDIPPSRPEAMRQLIERMIETQAVRNSELGELWSGPVFNAMAEEIGGQRATWFWTDSELGPAISITLATGFSIVVSRSTGVMVTIGDPDKHPDE